MTQKPPSSLFHFNEADDNLSASIIEAADSFYVTLSQLKKEIDQFVFGQEHVIENTLVSLLSGGHALLVGVPGLAKTRLVETIGKVLGLAQKRIQFTPDLMPSDIIGSEVLEEKEGQRSFRYVKGPIFTQLLMADEINRASPRTQAALLQAMQEYHVTVAGVPYNLPRPFHVLATQNPLEQEGTYPLPEAQLDRFLMQISIQYPDFETEKRILLETTSAEEREIKAILTPEKLIQIQKFIRKMPLPDSVVEAILTLVRSARPDADNYAKNYVLWGPGPRAAQALALCVRARALYNGRLAPALEDVKILAKPILRHRIALNFSARAEMLDIDTFIDLLMEDIFPCP